MRFIEVEVKTAIIAHGFNEANQPIEETVDEPNFVTKIVSVDRIRSISEDYLLVSAQDGREMYWAYCGTLAEMKEKLARAGLLVE